MSTAPTTSSGGCLCGAVTYAVTGPLRPVVCCHCEQCRKSSGHYVAASASKIDNLHISGEESLSWYRSSAKARRGFCSTCGSNLFWRPDHQRYISIMAGTLERPTGLATACHIYVDMASDYYSLADGLPQHGEDYPDALMGELE
ncbi:MAG: GFA family protein [Gammaproteobacteria bacterium]|nr:GFA family protein [Gammaproteobacteria bacterium]